MTSLLGSNIKRRGSGCKWMIRFGLTHTHRSLLTPATTVIKGHTIISPQTEETHSLGSAVGRGSLASSRRRPPAAKLLFFNTTPQVTLVNMQLFRPDAPPVDSDC